MVPTHTLQLQTQRVWLINQVWHNTCTLISSVTPFFLMDYKKVAKLFIITPKTRPLLLMYKNIMNFLITEVIFQVPYIIFCVCVCVGCVQSARWQMVFNLLWPSGLTFSGVLNAHTHTQSRTQTHGALHPYSTRSGVCRCGCWWVCVGVCVWGIR